MALPLASLAKRVTVPSPIRRHQVRRLRSVTTTDAVMLIGTPFIKTHSLDFHYFRTQENSPIEYSLIPKSQNGQTAVSR
ncbi:hypothetical protein [Variovorax paradoxus]|uniref:hypothetical protein n=1 Tax=Variovorax paradoxus TaxID=34073 RepID=UPI001C129970|nr:hypothetical protein [Variovorax paradoxus]